ncbi:MAG TPA: GTPase ObgE [Rhabdochlamydiaceae bacterium]|nr:GTPase ObgE [Rhabdochlamydiaceae bacterium]
MFVDTVRLTLSAGQGGNGVVAWRREKFIPKGGPAGGNGGKGGSITLRSDAGVLSLEGLRNQRIIKAENGMPGGGSLKQGRNGKNLVLTIPCGTLVKDTQTQQILFDFTQDKQEFQICCGGRGGKGNNCFKSPTNQAPNICTEGKPGEAREVELELKLIADVGLIGMPNAGKSTLMSRITHLKVKIAAYPFTTLYPNLSYVQFEDFSRVLVADIPGIIKDAHENKGLGTSFLRHIERSSTLIYVLDISGMEGRDPIDDFQVLQNELKAYKQEMMDKPFLVALNKIDMEGAEEQVQRFRESYPFPKETLFEISAMENQGISPLIEALRGCAQATGKRFK